MCKGFELLLYTYNTELCVWLAWLEDCILFNWFCCMFVYFTYRKLYPWILAKMLYRTHMYFFSFCMGELFAEDKLRRLKKIKNKKIGKEESLCCLFSSWLSIILWLGDGFSLFPLSFPLHSKYLLQYMIQRQSLALILFSFAILFCL